MLAVKPFQNPEASRDAVIRKSGYEFELASHLSWTHISEHLGENTDLRSIIPGLEKHEDPILVKDVVVDSDMGLQSAFNGIDINCPDKIVAAQELVRVYYFSTDNKLHVGEVLLHHALVDDVRSLFSEVILPYKIPIGPMVPVSNPNINWDDHRSMDNNHGAAFNYRQMINTDGVKQRLSFHAFGLAFDINPMLNPCLGEGLVSIPGFKGRDSMAGYQGKLPTNANYDLSNPGSFHDRHPVVIFLEEKGWTWGGKWGDPKDLHHFQKVPAEIADEVKAIRDQGIPSNLPKLHADNNPDLAQALQQQGAVMLVGRSLVPEYVKMFGLDLESLPKETRILDIAGGVASFTAEMHALGFSNVHSADPIYRLDVNEIINRANPFLADWASKFPNLEVPFAGVDGNRPAWLAENPLPDLDTPAKMLAIRNQGLLLFARDFKDRPDAYKATELPNLTGLTSEDKYDLILAGNFLMAYTSQNMELTIRSIVNASEHLSDNGEIRIYPAGTAFKAQEEVLREILPKFRLELEVLPSEHRFVRGWDAMYKITKI